MTDPDPPPADPLHPLGLLLAAFAGGLVWVVLIGLLYRIAN